MIERVTIRNFKSIGEVTVDLASTTVLVGGSGAGKSNFFRAIRFLRNFLLDGHMTVALEGGWTQIYPFGQPSPLQIGIVFGLPGYDESFAYEVVWAADQNGLSSLTSEKLMLGDRLVFGCENGKWLGGGSAGPQDLKSAEVVLGGLPSSTEAVLCFSALANGVGWHEFPSTVLRRSKTLQLGVPASQPEGQLLLNRGLEDDASNFPVVLLNLTQDLRDQHSRRRIVARLRQVNPSVASVEVNSLRWPTNIVVGHRVRGGVTPLDLSQESDGFRRYYAHLLALYQTPPKQVLMFEEPENGIAPGALRNLAEEFRAAPVAGRGQVLLSTQSPELLDGFEPEQIRVVDLDPETQLTRIGRLAPDQVDAVRDNLLHPGELLTVDVARRDVGLATSL